MTLAIIEKLNDVFRMVFDDDSIQINPGMTANDIDGWDSLSHINLITAVEQKFDLCFTQDELLTFKNIGDLINVITNRIDG